MFQISDLLPPPADLALVPSEGRRGPVFRTGARRASRIAARDGRPVEAPAGPPVRVVPPGLGSPAPTPLVVLIHGGCQAPADYAGAAAIFARHGFHVALLREHRPGPGGLHPFPVRPRPDLHLPTLDEKTCEASLMTRLDEVLASYPVDASRVFVAGFSQGGRLAFRLALLHPSRFRGAVPIAGPLAPEDVPLEGSLPVPPLLVCHSPQDRVVPAEWSRDGLALLSSRGVYPEFRPFAGGHALEAPLIEGIARWMVAILRD